MRTNAARCKLSDPTVAFSARPNADAACTGRIVDFAGKQGLPVLCEYPVACEMLPLRCHEILCNAPRYTINHKRKSTGPAGKNHSFRIVRMGRTGMCAIRQGDAESFLSGWGQPAQDKPAIPGAGRREVGRTAHIRPCQRRQARRCQNGSDKAASRAHSIPIRRI